MLCGCQLLMVIVKNLSLHLCGSSCVLCGCQLVLVMTTVCCQCMRGVTLGNCVVGQLEYQAQSPDEAALVSAARNFGFIFMVRHHSVGCCHLSAIVNFID